jgi:hypothetical protein
MSQYKGAMVRNALLAAIGIILIVSFALFGSTVVGQIHHFPASTQIKTSTRAQSSFSIHITSSNSDTGSSSTSASSETSDISSKTNGSGPQPSDTTSTTTQPISSASTSPATQNIPPSTIAEIPFSASAFAYDNYSNIIYSASTSSNSSILEINATTNDVIGEIILPNETQVNSVIFNSVNRELYLSMDHTGGTVSSSVIAVNLTSDSVVMNLTGAQFGQLAIDPIHNRVFASGLSYANDTDFLNVTVINGTDNAIEDNLTLDATSGPDGGCCILGPLLYNPNSGYLYLSSGAHGFDGGFGPFLVAYDTLTNTSSVGNFTDFGNYGTADFLYNAQSGVTYISNNGYASATGAYNPPLIVPGDNITVVSGTSYISSITVDNSNQNGTLGSIVYDSLNHEIIVANGSLNSNASMIAENLTMINSSDGMVMHAIPFQAGTINSLFFDPVNGDLYVADPNSIFVLTMGS